MQVQEVHATLAPRKCTQRGRAVGRSTRDITVHRPPTRLSRECAEASIASPVSPPECHRRPHTRRESLTRPLAAFRFLSLSSQLPAGLFRTTAVIERFGHAWLSRSMLRGRSTAVRFLLALTRSASPAGVQRTGAGPKLTHVLAFGLQFLTECGGGRNTSSKMIRVESHQGEVSQPNLPVRTSRHRSGLGSSLEVRGVFRHGSRQGASGAPQADRRGHPVQSLHRLPVLPPADHSSGRRSSQGSRPSPV